MLKAMFMGFVFLLVVTSAKAKTLDLCIELDGEVNDKDYLYALCWGLEDDQIFSFPSVLDGTLSKLGIPGFELKTIQKEKVNDINDIISNLNADIDEGVFLLNSLRDKNLYKENIPEIEFNTPSVPLFSGDRGSHIKPVSKIVVDKEYEQFLKELEAINKDFNQGNLNAFIRLGKFLKVFKEYDLGTEKNRIINDKISSMKTKFFHQGVLKKDNQITYRFKEEKSNILVIKQIANFIIVHNLEDRLVGVIPALLQKFSGSKELSSLYAEFYRLLKKGDNFPEESIIFLLSQVQLHEPIQHWFQSFQGEREPLKGIEIRLLCKSIMPKYESTCISNINRLESIL